MERKITIRRVGGLLPALCLVVLVLLASILIWLSTAGLPQSVLRDIEAAAAKQGIYLHIDKIRLAPSAGLAARAYGVTLRAAPGDAEPLARIHKATVAIRAMELLRGDIRPHMVQVYGLEASLPCTAEGEALQLSEGNLAASIHEDGLVSLTAASLKLGGISLRLRGSFHLPDENTMAGADVEASPLDLATELRPWQEEVDALHRLLSQQSWEETGEPAIELNIEDARGLRLNVQADFPSFDYQQFHLREARLNAAYHQGSLTVNNLNFITVAPAATFTVQGAFDLAENRLTFSLKSTAALARMAEAFDLPGANEWLARYQHEDSSPPSVTLNGDIRLEEDYSPQSITLRGRMQQEQFRYADKQVDSLDLSFYYKDGEFNIDKLHLNFPEGSLDLTASASGKTGQGLAHIALDMETGLVLALAGEFAGSPITLPEGLDLQGRFNFTAKALLDMPAFIAGQTDWRHYVPSLRSLDLTLGIDHAAHFGCILEKPSVSLYLDGIRHDSDLVPEHVGHASLAASAQSATVPDIADDALVLANASLGLDLDGLLATAQDLSLDRAQGKLQLGGLKLKDLNTGELTLAIDELRGLRPLEANWRDMLRQLGLRLDADAMQSGDTRLGKLDSELRLEEDGRIDLKLNIDRDGHRMELELHPRLRDDGMLVLDNVALEIPAAAFEPLLALADIDLPYFRLPETVSIAGKAAIDTGSGQLKRADGTLDIPHLVRTPGQDNKVLQGQEIPLALKASFHARERQDGHLGVEGGLVLTHKAGSLDKPDNRVMELDYRAGSDGLIYLSGTSELGLDTINAVVDHRDAHPVLRDFSCGKDTRTLTRIHSATVDLSHGIDVHADCDIEMDNFGYQLSAVEDTLDAQGKPTGQEKLRRDLGADPFVRFARLTSHVKVHRRMRCKDDSGVPLPNVSLVTFENAEATYDNRPWQKRKKLKGGPKQSTITARKVVIDVENSFVETVDVAGKVYPAYSLGAFYDDLYGFLDITTLRQPASMEAAHCLFPIYDDCKREQEGCIRLMAREMDLRFLGTTFPLRSFSGFIWLRDGSVYLDKLNAACWEGAIDAAINIDYSGKRTALDGYAIIRNMNLRPIAASYGSKQSDALCNGQIRFRSPSPEVSDIDAYGELHIVNGDLMELSIFRPVGELITDLPGYFTALEKKAADGSGEKPGWVSRQASALFRSTGKLIDDVGDGIGTATNNIPFANHFLRYDLQEVHGQFLIDRGWLRTRNLKAVGYNLKVSLRLAINLDSLAIQGNIWPQISSVPTIILSPLTFLSKYVVDINVYGTVEDLKWRFGLDKRLKDSEAPETSATDKPGDGKFKPRRP